MPAPGPGTNHRRIGSRLVQDRYLDDAIRQHLHEWLRFTEYIGRCGGASPASRTDEIVRRYVAERTRTRVKAMAALSVRRSVSSSSQMRPAGVGAEWGPRDVSRSGSLTFPRRTPLRYPRQGNGYGNHCTCSKAHPMTSGAR